MQLNRICNDFAAKILSTPGTVVECMDDKKRHPFLIRGTKYTVIDSENYHFGTDIFLKGLNHHTFTATRFRKVNDE